MKKILKEPLLHFILIGAAFFLLFGLVSTEESDAETIVIDESDLNEIVAKFQTQWKRLPTEDELISILNTQIDEEIFYQEALKLNLDHNDEIIKRRLAQKMKFLSKDIASVAEPTAEQLKTFYQDHLDDYMVDAHYTFYQVFFSPDTRENWRADAQSAITEANNLPLQEANTLGDPVALPSFFENTSAFHIERQMGRDFTEALSDLAIGVWQGPVESGYGAHLVYVQERIESQAAPFENVQETVLEDFQYQNQRDVEAALLEEYRKIYQVKLDVQGDDYSPDMVERISEEIGVE